MHLLLRWPRLFRAFRSPPLFVWRWALASHTNVCGFSGAQLLSNHIFAVRYTVSTMLFFLRRSSYTASACAFAARWESVVLGASPPTPPCTVDPCGAVGTRIPPAAERGTCAACARSSAWR